jgi:hypothetical protein
VNQRGEPHTVELRASSVRDTQNREPLQSLASRQAMTVFAVALTARLGYAVLVADHLSWAQFGHGGELGQIAQNLAEGRGFSSPFGVGRQPTAWFAPIVPMLWGALFRLQGVFAPATLWEVVGLQAVAGSCACAFYQAIFRALGERAGLSGVTLARWAWGFGLGIALWPESIKVEAAPWYFAFQDLGFAAMVWMGLRWLSGGGSLAAARLGVISALTGLVNPIPCPFLAYPIVMYAWARRAQSTRSTLREVGSALAAAFVLITPWMVRNRLAIGTWTPLRSNFGVELRQGNNLTGSVVQNANSIHPALRADERARYYELGEAAYSAWCTAEAVRFMRTHPLTTAQRTVSRVYVFWFTDLFGWWPWTGHFTPWSELRISAFLLRLLRVGAAVLPVLALGALLVSGTARQVPYWSMFAFVLGILPAPFYITHVDPDYPLAFKPYLLLWLALSLCIVAGGRERRRSPEPQA